MPAKRSGVRALAMRAGKSKEQGGDQTAALTLSLPEFCEVVVRLANIQFRTHVRRKQTQQSFPFAVRRFDFKSSPSAAPYALVRAALLLPYCLSWVREARVDRN